MFDSVMDAAMLLLCAVGVAGNGWCLWRAARGQQRRATAGACLLALALVGLVDCALVGALSADRLLLGAFAVDWPGACAAVYAVEGLSRVYSPLVVAIIAVDRHHAVISRRPRCTRSPLSLARSRRQHARIRLALLALFAVSALLVAPHATHSTVVYSVNTGTGHAQAVCDVAWPDEWPRLALDTLVLLVAFVAPLAVVAAVYALIVRSVWTYAHQQHCRSTVCVARTARRSLAVVVACLLCYAPYWTLYAWHLVQTMHAKLELWPMDEEFEALVTTVAMNETSLLQLLHTIGVEMPSADDKAHHTAALNAAVLLLWLASLATNWLFYGLLGQSLHGGGTSSTRRTLLLVTGESELATVSRSR